MEQGIIYVVTPELGAAIGFGIAALILALRLVKRKKPAWAYKTTRIMGLGTDAPPELKLYFNNTPIEDVYRTTFIFFNRGTETIRKEDVTENVTVHFTGAQILREPTIKLKSKEAIQFSEKRVVKDGDNSVELDFLYLDHGDGAVIEVLHTKADNIRYSGNIMGTKITQCREFEQFRPPFHRSAVMPWLIIGALGGVGIAIDTYVTEPTERIIAQIQASVSSRVLVLVFFAFWLFALVRASVDYFGYHGFPKWSTIPERSSQ